MWIKEVIGENATAVADETTGSETDKTTSPSSPSTQNTTTKRTAIQTTTRRSTTTTTAARISTTATSTTRTDNIGIGELLNFLSCLPRDLDAYKKYISAAE